MIEINKDSPVRASDKIEIAASPQKIWHTMADMDKWSEWNPDVK